MGYYYPKILLAIVVAGIEGFISLLVNIFKKIPRENIIIEYSV
jgi:hypothetical protein